jgi:parallel beta-helix repeat protein
VHKKYTYKDGKRYGPYVYETKRVGDRVVTNYLGPDSAGWKKKLLLVAGIIVIVAVFLLLVYLPAPSSTGRVSFDLQVNSYLPGQKILGVINLFFKPGEFVQQNAIVRVKLGDQVKDIPVSELMHTNVVDNGNYYAEGVQLSGSGPGYGQEGEIISSPFIDAELRVYTPSSTDDVSLSPDESGASVVGNSVSNAGSEGSGRSSPSGSSEVSNAGEGVSEQGNNEVSSDSSNDQQTEANTPSTTTVKEHSSSSSASKPSDTPADSTSTDSGVTGNVVSDDEQIIPIRVSRNEPYSYKLESGQRAEIVDGSTTIDGESVSDSVLSVDVSDGEAKVTTSFFTTVHGYGPEFLGKEPAFTVHIDIDDLSLVAQEEGDMSVELIGDDQVIASHKESIAVAEPTLADVPVEPVEPVALSPPVVNDQIPSVRLSPGEVATVDLSLYFNDATSYTVELSEVTGTIEGSLLTLSAPQDKLARRAVVTASNDAGEVASSFLVVVSSGSISYKTEGRKIVVKAGEQAPPVELTTTVTSDEPLSSISLPASATNIEVNKEVDGELVSAVEPSSSSITGGGITGNVIIEVDAGKNAKNSFKHILKRIKAAFTGNVIAEDSGNEALTQSVSLPSTSDDGASTYVVTYELPAPKAEVKDTAHGQELVVSGPDDYHYPEVIVSSDIGHFKIKDKSQVQLFLLTDAPDVSDELLKDPSDVGETFVDTVTDNTLAEPGENGVIVVPDESSTSESDISVTGNAIVESAPELDNAPEVGGQQEKRRVAVPFDVYDTDEDGFLDYLELATSLSEQEYEIIIIVNANHLDETRTFISDIYDSVKELDGNWSETIPDGHYVRVTFEKNLTSVNDITIYPRVVSGTPRVEVYKANSDVLLEQFTTINDNEYNKIYLTNLTLPEDTFDLRIVGGACEFDHIIDPFADNGSAVQYIQSCGNLTTAGATYYVNGSFTPSGGNACINVTAANVVFDCAGYSLLGPSYTKPVVFTNQDNLTVRNCNLSASSTSGGVGIQLGGTASYAVVNNNTIRARIGIQLTGTGTNILIANTSVLNNGGPGCTNAISITGTPANSTIINFTGSGCSGNLIAAATNTLFNITISQSSFISSGGAAGVNLQIASSLIDSNNFTRSSSNGLTLSAGSGQNNTIANNIFSLNTLAGLKIAGANSSLVKNNTFLSNNVGLNATISNYGIFNNNFFDNNTVGIGVSFPSVGNVFVNNTLNRSTSVALRLDGTPTAAVVEGTIFDSSNNTYANISITNAQTGALDLFATTAYTNNASLFTLIDSNLGNYSFTTGFTATFNYSRFGTITFLQLITGTGINLSSEVFVINNSAYFNKSKDGLNKSANITLYGLPLSMTSPSILKDGVACGSACYNFTALTAGTVVFNVSSGGNYTINYTVTGADTTSPLVTINLPTNTTSILCLFCLT